MPRSRTPSRKTLATSAMWQFWAHGYSASSLDALVKATGVSRHGIYQDAGGKEGLFLQAVAAYRDAIVSPAFAQVETEDAGPETLRTYLETQITLAEEVGLPGLGCLMANTMTEPAAQTPDVKAAIDAHLARFERAVLAIVIRTHPNMASDTALARAEAFVAALQGLWAVSRQTSSTARLRRIAAELMTLVERP